MYAYAKVGEINFKVKFANREFFKGRAGRSIAAAGILHAFALDDKHIGIAVGGRHHDAKVVIVRRFDIIDRVLSLQVTAVEINYTRIEQRAHFLFGNIKALQHTFRSGRIHHRPRAKFLQHLFGLIAAGINEYHYERNREKNTFDHNAKIIISIAMHTGIFRVHAAYIQYPHHRVHVHL